MVITLRVADANDANAILELNLRSILEICSTAYDEKMLRRWVGSRTAETFATLIQRGGIRVAECAGKIVGFSDISEREIMAIYVLPGWERKGVGTMLLSHAIEELREAGGRIAVLASLNAVSFYQRHGFYCISQTFDSRNGVELAVMKMELRLTL